MGASTGVVQREEGMGLVEVFELERVSVELAKEERERDKHIRLALLTHGKTSPHVVWRGQGQED